MLNKEPEAQSWSVAQHDTIPQVDLWINPTESHVYLRAFLESEGASFTPPYTAVRERVDEALTETEDRKRRGQSPRSDVADSRLRTWKSVFEAFGLLRVQNQDSSVELTRMGRAVRDLYRQIDQKIAGANDHLAKLGIAVLNRYVLRNPLDAGEYPSGSDVRPFTLIWRAMRQLNNKLHWEELNRVLMKVIFSRDEVSAIDRIRSVRSRFEGAYSPEHLSELGDPCVNEGQETKRRITPWFTRAGFGGLLISAQDDDDGYRHLDSRYVHLIDEALAAEISVPESALASREAYLAYLNEIKETPRSELSVVDQSAVDEVLKLVDRYGNKKIICIAGIPGTGKTRLAKLVSDHICESDPYRFQEVQFHETTSYSDFIEGFVPRPDGNGFELRPKVFRSLNRRAALDPAGKRFVLLIEEFTRANVHSILGELLTYIEHRDRKFTLALSQEEISVSPNLVVIATMNPRDKSALSLDHAILRRMSILTLPPSSEILKSMLANGLEPSLLKQLGDWYTKYESILPFGHGVFEQVGSADDLQELWNSSLIHFFLDIAGEIRSSLREAADTYPWK